MTINVISPPYRKIFLQLKELMDITTLVFFLILSLFLYYCRQIKKCFGKNPKLKK